MPTSAEIFRELHRLRVHAKDLSEELDRGPKVLKQHEAKVERQEALMKELQDSIKKLKVQTHEKEVTLKGKVQTIEKYQRQLNEIKGTKEFEALKKEIAHEKEQCAQLENEILEAIEQTEIMTGKIPECQKNVEALKKDSTRVKDDIQTRRNQVVDMMAKVHEEIKQVESTLNLEHKGVYDRLVGARGEDALSGLEGRVCVACYTEITTQALNEIKQGKLVICKNCDRILYLKG